MRKTVVWFGLTSSWQYRRPGSEVSSVDVLWCQWTSFGLVCNLKLGANSSWLLSSVLNPITFGITSPQCDNHMKHHEPIALLWFNPLSWDLINRSTNRSIKRHLKGSDLAHFYQDPVALPPMNCRKSPTWQTPAVSKKVNVLKLKSTFQNTFCHECNTMFVVFLLWQQNADWVYERSEVLHDFPSEWQHCQTTTSDNHRHFTCIWCLHLQDNNQTDFCI